MVCDNEIDPSCEADSFLMSVIAQWLRFDSRSPGSYYCCALGQDTFPPVTQLWCETV